MVGDVPGENHSTNYTVSLEDCKRDCDDRRDCNAFEYSKTSDNGCKLLTKSVPTNPKFKDFQFCKKNKTGTSLHEYNICLFLNNVLLLIISQM